jgi:alpha-glucosidase
VKGVIAMAGLTLALPAVASAQQWTVESPDRRNAVALERHPDGHLTWSVNRGGVPILEASPLGIRRDDTAFVDGLTVVDTRTRIIDERYTTPHGKRRDHRVRARERTVTFANAAGARLDVIVRAHDDGAAVRYRFPSKGARHTVMAELTGFKVPGGSTAWLMPQQEVHQYGPAYEELFEEVASGTAAPRADGWAFPALFRTAQGKWLLLHESGLDGEYCGSHLAATVPGGVYTIAFPDANEGLGVGERLPASSLPWTTPWRVVITGDSAGDILVSDLVNDLSPPSQLKDTSWIRPGRASWSWWSASDSPKHAAQLNAFIDMGADMGWEYALVDAYWNLMETGRIDDVIAHAKQKGVGLFFWYNSGGPHNDVTEAPRDRMHTRDVRRAEFAKLRDWGVKGVKVDFWHSDKQDRIRQYRDILEDAADFQLMVNFHGSTIPRGWQREFPHLVSMESVFGAEQYKFREAFARRAAVHNTILPFTRNVVGSMDYTPVTFSNAKFPHRTTNAHELAQAVVFESGVQHFADSVDSYRNLPEAARSLLKAVPAAWDETRAIAGEPGQLVVVARRNGREWYVGGVNGREVLQDVSVPLGFLGSGSWTASVIRDGGADRTLASDTRTVTTQDTISISMRGRGGFVMHLVPSAAGGTQ